MNNDFPDSRFSRNPIVRVIHTAVKGRARYKVERLHHSTSLKQYIELKLNNEALINDVFANSLTGSVLVIFQPDFSPKAIALLIEKIVLDFQRKNTKSLAQTSVNGRVKDKTQHLSSLSKTKDYKNKISKQAKSGQEQQILPWHILQVETAIADLHTSATSGLSSNTAQS